MRRLLAFCLAIVCLLVSCGRQRGVRDTSILLSHAPDPPKNAPKSIRQWTPLGAFLYLFDFLSHHAVTIPAASRNSGSLAASSRILYLRIFPAAFMGNSLTNVT